MKKQTEDSFGFYFLVVLIIFVVLITPTVLTIALSNWWYLLLYIPILAFLVANRLYQDNKNNK